MTGTIEMLFLPPAGNFLMALLGLWLMRRRRRLGLALVLAALGSLAALATPIVAAALLVSLQTSPALPPEGELPEAQAIVILAGDFRARAPEMGRPTLSALTLERVRYGAMLARRSGLPVLATGGPLGPKEPAISTLMRRALQDEFAVPVRWTEDRAGNTRQNADFSSELLAADGVQRVLLVTHAWHMPRAVRAFEVAGLEVVPAPTAFKSWPPRELAALIPTARNLQESYWALHEWLGRGWYALTE